MSDADFDALALAVVRFQLEENPTYGRFGAGRGVTPDRLEHWTEAPMVPTRAFKVARMAAGDVDQAQAVFRTSGTSLGEGSRGVHPVLDLELYRASLLPNFARHLLPDGARLPLIALLPHPTNTPDSSLSHMMGVVEEELCTSGGGWFFDSKTGLDVDGLERCVARHAAAGQPVLVAGTAFALVHWVDALASRGTHHLLPVGSRVMETGGFKGRSRVVSRAELYRELASRLGLAEERIVGEYGMTELLSQFYEPVLPSGAVGDPDARGGRPGSTVDRVLVGPPWARTRVLDPETLAPLEPGAVGLLHHFDLANVLSVSSVLTEDMGAFVDGGFRVLGRARDGEPRGCSMMMEDFLTATEKRA